MLTMRRFHTVLPWVTLLLLALSTVAGAKEKVILDSDRVVLYDDGVAMSIRIMAWTTVEASATANKGPPGLKEPAFS